MVYKGRNLTNEHITYVRHDPQIAVHSVVYFFHSVVYMVSLGKHIMSRRGDLLSTLVELTFECHREIRSPWSLCCSLLFMKQCNQM